MKKLLLTFILCLLAKNPLIALPLEHAMGLTAPFEAKNTQHLSPLEGMNIDEIKGLRFHGRYSDQDMGFPAVEHKLLKADDLPMDAIAALIQRLFPSPAHDVLTPNNISSRTDALRKWITPAKIAKLFNTTSHQEKFAALPKEERLFNMMSALADDFAQQSKQNKNVKLSHSEFLKKYGKNEKKPSKCIRLFAELLDEALMTTRNPKHDSHHFYPSHIVERALLTFATMKAESKADLKPYFDTLSDELIDRKINIDFDTKLTEDHYKKLKEEVTKDKFLSDELALEIATDPEKILNIAMGYDLFESRLPPVAPYGEAFYTDPNGNKRKLPNCGEAASHNFINALFFNPDTRIFDLSVLNSALATPSQAVKDFYIHAQSSADQVQDQETYNAWAQLVSNLNQTSGEQIQYCKLDGKNVADLNDIPNGIYEMNAGLDNFLRVIGRVLGIKTWQKMDVNEDGFFDNIAANLTQLCKAFSSEERKIDWQVKGATPDDAQKIEKLTSLDLIFKFNHEDVFSLHFGKHHFYLTDLNVNENNWRISLVLDLKNAENLPYQHHLGKLYGNTYLPYCKDAQKRIFQLNLNHLDARFSALRVLMKDRAFAEKYYGFLLKRWLTPEGEFFGEWEDEYARRSVLSTLLLAYSTSEIHALKIKPLSKMLSPQKIRKTFRRMASSAVQKQAAKNLLQEEGMIEQLSKPSDEDNDRCSELVTKLVLEKHDPQATKAYITMQLDRDELDHEEIGQVVNTLCYGNNKACLNAVLDLPGFFTYLLTYQDELSKAAYADKKPTELVVAADRDDMIEKAISAELEAGMDVEFNKIVGQWNAPKVDTKIWELLRENEANLSDSKLSTWLTAAKKKIDFSAKKVQIADLKEKQHYETVDFLLAQGATLDLNSWDYKDIAVEMLPLIYACDKVTAQKIIGEWIEHKLTEKLMTLDSDVIQVGDISDYDLGNYFEKIVEIASLPLYQKLTELGFDFDKVNDYTKTQCIEYAERHDMHDRIAFLKAIGVED